MQLEKAFEIFNKRNETHQSAVSWASFIGYWPALYAASRRFGAPVLLALSGAYYFGVYRGLTNLTLGWMQGGLNAAAAPYVTKYDIKMPDRY